MKPKNRSRTRPSRRHWIALIAAAALIAGCGSDGDDQDDGTTGITREDVAAIEDGASRDALAGSLGVDPVLIAEATKDAPGGCDYYSMPAPEAPVNLWAFCFDARDELTTAEAQFAPAGSSSPEGGTPEQAALIGAGDFTCNADYEELGTITEAVGKALDEFAAGSSAESREAVGDAIADFVANIEHTHAGLSAFEAPEEESEALTAYLKSLQEQIDLLGKARTAFLDGDLDAYDKLGDEFTEIGEKATDQAKEYGFGVCSASNFG